MLGENRLKTKLDKLEALFRGTGSLGERAAAAAAMDRLHGRLGSSKKTYREPEIELRISLSDSWSVRLFIAICRKHGVRPYRYPRQRRTTIMVYVREREFDRSVWSEYEMLQRELSRYFEDVTDDLIKRAMGSDGDDSGLEQQKLPAN